MLEPLILEHKCTADRLRRLRVLLVLRCPRKSFYWWAAAAVCRGAVGSGRPGLER